MSKKNAKAIKQLFKGVKLLILDVDGVLTNEEIVYDSSGKELKFFNVKDGLGIYLLKRAGFKTLLLTAKDSSMVKQRARDFGADVIGGILPKETVLPSITAKYGVELKDICFVGDDIIDIGVLKRVGIPVAVKNACQDVKKQAVYITKCEGGRGAVREVVEIILKAKGLWKVILNDLGSYLVLTEK